MTSPCVLGTTSSFDVNIYHQPTLSHFRELPHILLMLSIALCEPPSSAAISFTALSKSKVSRDLYEGGRAPAGESNFTHACRSCWLKLLAERYRGSASLELRKYARSGSEIFTDGTDGAGVLLAGWSLCLHLLRRLLLTRQQ